MIDDETMENVCILAKLSLTEDEKEKAKEDMTFHGIKNNIKYTVKKHRNIT